MNPYLSLKDQHSESLKRLQNRFNLISAFRLSIAIILLVSLYYFFQTKSNWLLAVTLIALAVFIVLMNVHQKIARLIELTKALISINNDELIYLKHEGIPFQDGMEHNDFTHSYSYDLDVFGKNSLFQNLNRTATYIGAKTLADLLLSRLNDTEIISNQDAIKELAQKIGWRQDLLSLAKITNDSSDIYSDLIKWAESKSPSVPKIITAISFITPVLFFASIIALWFSGSSYFSNTASGLFILNLMVVFSQFKKIKKEIENSDKVHKTIKQYSLILAEIENTDFESEKLNGLKAQLSNQNVAASNQIKKLSSLFAAMDNIQNVVVTVLFNGAFLYHLHKFSSLLKWKTEYGPGIKKWLQVIGEFETINSLSNFSFNNPEFAFPKLNSNLELEFKELGHPLINKEKRICNTVTFTKQPFIILTGSNMSGKSTFLRTLGINMVLAGIGSPVCAEEANIQPMDVLVSMRLSDSLSDSESYFFAEVKRLKQIMNKLDEKICFVLLDEILRGTNSDDKRNGTIEVVKKLIHKNAIGAIATHDLEICNTTDSYPDKLKNMCFEVEIINNELAFDYKLRDGVCKNKSATFLMKKMEII